MTNSSGIGVDGGGGASFIGGGSPTQTYLYFLLSLCKNFVDVVSEGDELNESKTTRALSALISFCPSREKRRELLDMFIAERKATNVLTAATYTAGEFVSYITEVLELTSDDYGGLL